MKLRLLNAGHQAVAYFGHLMGYRYVHDAAQDPTFAGVPAALHAPRGDPDAAAGARHRPHRLHRLADRAVRQRRGARHRRPAGRRVLRPHPQVAGAGDQRQPRLGRRDRGLRGDRGELGPVRRGGRRARRPDRGGRPDRRGADGRRRPPVGGSAGLRPQSPTCSATSPTSPGSPSPTCAPWSPCTPGAPRPPSPTSPPGRSSPRATALDVRRGRPHVDSAERHVRSWASSATGCDSVAPQVWPASRRALSGDRRARTRCTRRPATKHLEDVGSCLTRCAQPPSNELHRFAA